MHAPYLPRLFHKCAAQPLVINHCKYAPGQYLVDSIIRIDRYVDIIHHTVKGNGDAQTRNHHDPLVSEQNDQQRNGNIELRLHAQTP
ncbi:hypothetical protein D3C73_1290060 [compost metagenome]